LRPADLWKKGFAGRACEEAPSEVVDREKAYDTVPWCAIVRYSYEFKKVVKRRRYEVMEAFGGRQSRGGVATQ
jgi:hypothetical protein